MTTAEDILAEADALTRVMVKGAGGVPHERALGILHVAELRRIADSLEKIEGTLDKLWGAA